MNFFVKNKKYFLVVLILFLFLAPLMAKADTLSEKRDFFVSSFYRSGLLEDEGKREKITATLQMITDQFYFYVESEWWDSLDIEARKKVNIALTDLDKEFKEKIYPVLTENYGSEWRPGIDNDERITILIHPMVRQAAGYFYSGDEYLQNQVSDSNQREMIYMSSDHIAGTLNKSFLAHEFVHLITFNQKDRAYGRGEDTWLNEARAEYASALLGYNNVYDGSNLQKRVEQFLNSSQDSLTEWQGKTADYGVLNLFTQYLVDQYGIVILRDSLKTDKTGIAALDYVLSQKGFKENFSQVFANWAVAIYLNNCDIGPKYCYLNENLKNFRLTPYIYFLPTEGDSRLNVSYLTKEWAGNWQKIIGGKKLLKLEFDGDDNVKFTVPYIIEDSSKNYSVKFLQLDALQKGSILVENGQINSLTIIPLAQSKTSGFTGSEKNYQFSWSVATVNPSVNGTTTTDSGNEELIKQLQQRIKGLQQQLAVLRAQLVASSSPVVPDISCGSFDANLYFGLRNNAEVNCLQQFLKLQGPEIYPEGLVTGNFLTATRAAVIRFQEKYVSEILTPVGLSRGTGYIGSSTRNKLNKLLAR